MRINAVPGIQLRLMAVAVFDSIPVRELRNAVEIPQYENCRMRVITLRIFANHGYNGDILFRQNWLPPLR